ncbi:MAG: acyl-CoA dehydrogenase family protein [Dehalococcoidia bacterium]|nr:acyl-CoA dehydrogenase family protein [Dehalococcoidia bacterium]
MDFKFSAEEEAFRGEVKDWLKTAIPQRWRELPTGFWQETEESWKISREFQKKLGAKGWLAPAYPVEMGGAGLGHIKRLILAEELTYCDAPVSIETEITVNWVGMALQHFGSEEQKKDYIPRIAKGDIIFCLGYSEPNAGSDLASLQTRATEQGDNYIINGQKIWCSYAHYADYCWLGAVTDPEAPKHRNMSMFVIDMKSPGITIRPLINVIGCHSFNEVFFDDVRAPKDSLVGQKNNGWFQLAMALDFERSGVQTAAWNKLILDHMITYAKTNKRNGRMISEDPIMRSLMAEMAIEIEVARMLCYRIAWIYSKGGHSNYESSQAMIFGSELLRRISDAGMRVAGQYGQLAFGSPRAIGNAEIFRSYLASLSIGVGGGTNEIQRNIIAMRGLGLPRK